MAVIITAYNHARFIQRTLDSVFAQTCQPAEIIVVDDNSTDGTFELLASYQPRITLLRKPADVPRGPAAGQNIALRLTSCAYVAFLDSDDLWMPSKIEKQVAALERHPDAGLCYCNGIAIDEQDRELYQILDETHRETVDPAVLLMDCYIVSPSKVMARRSIFDKVGYFREDLRYAHDHEMWLRIHEVSRAIYVPERLMAYRRHRQQGSLRREMWDTGFLILREALQRYPYGRVARRKRWAVLHYRLGEYHWKKKHAVAALHNFVLAALADPGRAIGELTRRTARWLHRPAAPSGMTSARLPNI